MKTFHYASMTLLFCFFSLTHSPIKADVTKTLVHEAFDSCPTAAFSVLNNGQIAGNPVSFSNESTMGLSYLWDFGDGQTSTAVHPVHIYGAAGTYTVKLTVTGEACTVEFIGTEDVLVF